MCTPQEITAAAPKGKEAAAASPVGTTQQDGRFKWNTTQQSNLKTEPSGVAAMGKNLSDKASKVPNPVETISSGPGVGSTGTQSYQGTIGASSGASKAAGKKSLRISR